MLTLNDLIGKTVLLSPKQKFDAGGGIYAVKLHSAEVGGIWVEHPALSKIVADAVHKTVEELPDDPVFFFPYSEIDHLVAYSTRIDEKTLGL